MMKNRLFFLLIALLLLAPLPAVAQDASKTILDVPSYNQQALGLLTGCEIVSLAMLINYRHEADIEALVDKMPYATDPEEGYRGRPYDKTGFTIFPPALMDLLSLYTFDAIDMTGGEIDDLKTQLASGIPVVVWVNGLGWNVHCIILTGFDNDGFFYNDPWTGGNHIPIAYDDFYAIWDNPIYDRVFNRYHTPKKAISYQHLGNLLQARFMEEPAHPHPFFYVPDAVSLALPAYYE